ncbi:MULTISPECIES: DUF1659 domain-containing protein [unclassified Bacillus (in: firmicutes)]|uniref:DUF1659 domain-containing protein n=1 Tax=unclassified Bacillus (in: firmicutes) TaxID=185979 RepID=UPI000BF12ACA|nr:MULTISPECIES: DUF1659 domain-containing protein [unclassified Bacillus (in: firmicutes)]PEJ53653.1 hypothetical protein CN692_20280 [Bacillus sp. AFS002410]PEL11133.1 hypothetical protein CN601_10250 [Bacillus sp. AFS017336]
MAQIATQQLTLYVNLHAGKDSQGKIIIKRKAYKNVRVDLDLVKLSEVGNALASLQELPLVDLAVLSNGIILNSL